MFSIVCGNDEVSLDVGISSKLNQNLQKMIWVVNFNVVGIIDSRVTRGE